MSVDLSRPIAVPAGKREQFRALTETPVVAVPTLVLTAIVIPSVLVFDFLAVTDRMSLYWAAAANIPLYYFFFSVIHDGVHRAIARDKRLNELICQMAITCYAPFAAIAIFRWAHMEHHRFTNDERDPDGWSHGPWWSLPFRWMTIDMYYAWRAINSENPAVRKVLTDSLKYMIPGVAFLIAAIALGYGYELLILWFIPSRLAFIGIGFSFFWLPHAHAPNENMELEQVKNFTIATTLRIGLERLLNPLLQYQNYHLIHHLWPTTPFYNNEKVFRLVEPELRQRDLAIVDPLAIQPRYEFSAATLASRGKGTANA